MKSIPIFDSHCHLHPHLIHQGENGDVCVESIVAGIAPTGWQAIDEVQSSSRCFAAYGVHPWNADEWNCAVADQLDSYLQRGAVAVGEIGLDGSIALSNEIQERAFRAQVAVAVRHNLPVILHCHKRLDRLFAILEEENVSRVGGVLHGFTGSIETAHRAIRNRLALGIGKAINWPSAVKLRAVVESVDADWLLIESDFSGSDSDVGERGILLSSIAQTVADIRGLNFDLAVRVTRENAKRIFRLGIK